MKATMRLSILIAVMTLRSASADPASIQAGLAAYEALDYARAVALLSQGFSESLDAQAKSTILRTLAFSHVALGDDTQARAEFRLLLRIDPNVALDRTISPRVRLIFEEARSEIIPGPEPPHPAVEPTTPQPVVVVVAPPKETPQKTKMHPLWRRGWVWGAAAGASAAVILVGVLAGVLTTSSTARVTVAHP
jgi:hypothetical protein